MSQTTEMIVPLRGIAINDTLRRSRLAAARSQRHPKARAHAQSASLGSLLQTEQKTERREDVLWALLALCTLAVVAFSLW